MICLYFSVIIFDPVSGKGDNYDKHGFGGKILQKNFTKKKVIFRHYTGLIRIISNSLYAHFYHLLPKNVENCNLLNPKKVSIEEFEYFFFG